jgi:hypothetical protein
VKYQVGKHTGKLHRWGKHRHHDSELRFGRRVEEEVQMSWERTVRPKSELKRMLHVATTQETLANTSATGKISCRPGNQASMLSFQGRVLLLSIVVSAENISKRLLRD